MEYQVPQFIDVEDKIFGPFTLRQFIYLAGGAGLVALVFFTLPFFFAAIISIPVIGFVAALAFYKMNNKPFIEIVEAAVTYAVSSRLYLWRRGDEPSAAANAQAAEATRAAARAAAANASPILPVSQGRLRDLAASLDVQDRSTHF